MAAEHLWCYMNDKYVGVLSRNKGQQSFAYQQQRLFQQQAAEKN